MRTTQEAMVSRRTASSSSSSSLSLPTALCHFPKLSVTSRSSLNEKNQIKYYEKTREILWLKTITTWKLFSHSKQLTSRQNMTECL